MIFKHHTVMRVSFLIKTLLQSSLVITFSAYADQPNILFIMSDDHASQAAGVYGGRLADLNPTPTIDSLAAEGIVMENAFCQNAHPAVRPS